jgi:hypothetical protein
MEVLNDVLAQARLSRIGRGEPQKMKGCLGGRCSPASGIPASFEFVQRGRAKRFRRESAKR